MKINFVIPTPGNTGGLQVIYKYAEEFQKKGHDVRIYYPLKLYLLDYSLNKFRQIMFVIYRTLVNIFHFCICHNEKKYNSKIIMKYVPVINDFFMPNADYIIATAWPTAYDVAKLSDKKGKKYYFIQDFEVWDDKKRGMQSYRLPLRHIVIAKWISDILDEKIGIKERVIINNGIDLDEYYNDNKNVNYNMPLHFLMLYHKLPKKGVKYGLKVFDKVLEKYPGSTLTMFGIKKEESLPKYVHFVENPTKSEIRKLYCEADVYIYPSLIEGWGLTVVEAMAAKCTVIGTNTGCMLDIGKDGENTLLSEPGDIDGMFDNIEKVIQNRNLLEKISFAGYETACTLSWEKSVEKFLDILQNY